MQIKIRDLHQQFCDECSLIRNYTHATIRWYKGVFRTFINCHPDIEFITDVTQPHIQKYLYDGRLKKNWKAETFLNYYMSLRAFFNWAVKRGYIEQNPVRDIEKPKIEKTLPKRLSKQEAMKVLEAAYHHDYRYKFEAYRNQAVIATFIFTGLRSKELLSLKLQDVDFENGIIHVQLGKGNKDRVIPISPRLKAYLSRYITERNKLKRTCDNIFVSTCKDAAYTYSGLKRLVANLKKRTGIHFSAHRLRHTFATLMLENGCDLFSLQKMMGHSDIKTTTLYLSATVKLLQEQILKHPMG